MNLSRKIDFDNLHNVRDLGGMRSENGSVIRSGCLYRAGHLFGLSDADHDKLKELAGVVIDLRTDKEREEKPDEIIEGVSYVHIPIMDSLTAGVTRESDADEKIFAELAAKPKEAKQYMCKMYRAFAKVFAVSQYAGFIRLLLKTNDKGILWHCTAGKDRAGVASVIVEEILEIPRKDIIADYMMTNKYLETDIAYLIEFIKKQLDTDSMDDRALRYLLGAQEEYVQSYYEAIEEKFGSFLSFIKKGLGLTDEEIRSLREKYMVCEGKVQV